MPCTCGHTCCHQACMSASAALSDTQPHERTRAAVCSDVCARGGMCVCAGMGDRMRSTSTQRARISSAGLTPNARSLSPSLCLCALHRPSHSSFVYFSSLAIACCIYLASTHTHTHIRTHAQTRTNAHTHAQTRAHRERERERETDTHTHMRARSLPHSPAGLLLASCWPPAYPTWLTACIPARQVASRCMITLRTH
jgi:hypothetical protein